MEEDERRLSFPPPAPLNSPGEEIDGSRLLGEIVRTLEATNPEAAAPLVASQSRDALDQESDRPRREELRIPLEGVTFTGDASAKGNLFCFFATLVLYHHHQHRHPQKET